MGSSLRRRRRAGESARVLGEWVGRGVAAREEAAKREEVIYRWGAGVGFGCAF